MVLNGKVSFLNFAVYLDGLLRSILGWSSQKENILDTSMQEILSSAGKRTNTTARRNRKIITQLNSSTSTSIKISSTTTIKIYTYIYIN